MSKDKSSKNKSKNKKEAEVQISKSYASSNSSDTTTAFSFKRLVNDYFTMNNMWIYLVIITVVFLIFFQYKYEMAERASSGMEDSEVNYYEILDIDSSADLATIRKKYKDLAKIWHPDKHQDCKICKEKFALISKAYEVLSDDAKKGDYDHRSGKSIFSSEPITLTEANYHRLVEESNEFWIIVVYENRTKDRFLQSFADVFDEVALKYRNIIKFGAIDVLRHEGLLKYLPYNFPIIPSIYTFRNGEDCEIFPNIDEFSVKAFVEFIENFYTSKVNFIDHSDIQQLVLDQGKTLEVSKESFKVSDLDLKVIILSSKRHIDIVVKDFAQIYEKAVEVKQTDFTSFDKSLKLLKTNGQNRVYLSYNTYDVNENKMKRTLTPIPVKFSLSSNLAKKYQLAFNLIKSIVPQRIYKSNYVKHCVNKIQIEGEEQEIENANMKMNLCVILLERENENKNESLMNSFHNTLVNNFNKTLKKFTTPQKKNREEEYSIEMNFGIASLQDNPEVKSLYTRYLQEREMTIPDKAKVFMIINNTNEKFILKTFTDPLDLSEYLSRLDNSEDFEDLSLGFDYFADYNVREIQKLFNDEKIFSVTKILIKTWYSQTRMLTLTFLILIFTLAYRHFDKNEISQYYLFLVYALIFLVLFGVNLMDSLFH